MPQCATIVLIVGNPCRNHATFFVRRQLDCNTFRKAGVGGFSRSKTTPKPARWSVAIRCLIRKNTQKEWEESGTRLPKITGRERRDERDRHLVLYPLIVREENPINQSRKNASQVSVGKKGQCIVNWNKANIIRSTESITCMSVLSLSMPSRMFGTTPAQ